MRRVPPPVCQLLLLATLIAAMGVAPLLGRPCPWGSGVCLLPANDAPDSLIRWIVGLMLLGHGLVVPGWIVASLLGVPPLIRAGCAIPLSAVVWCCLHIVLRVAGIQPIPFSTGMGVAVVEGALLLLAWRGRRGIPLRPRPAEAGALIAGLALVVLVGPGRLATQSLDGDGVEAVGFALSLNDRLVPRWDLENGTWGFYPAFMSFAYPLNLSLSLLGPSEAAARLPVVFLAAGLAGLVAAGHRGAMRGALMVAAVLVVVTSGLNYTYEPYSADIAEPTVTDLFFTVSLLCMLWAWHQRKVGLYAVTAALAVTGQPAGLPFIALLIAGGLVMPSSRPFALRALGVMVMVCAARSIADRLLNPPGDTKFSAATFLAHHTGALSPHMGARQMATQLWALLVQTAGAPVVFAAAYARDARRGGPRLVTYAAVAIYLVAVVFSPKRHPHYLTPVAAMLLFLVPSRAAMPRVWPIMIIGALAGVLPSRDCPVDTRPAEFGRATWMVFPTERQAVENADLLYRVLTVPPWRDEGQWGIGKHAWVLYSSRAESLPTQAPEGIHVLLSNEPRSWEGFVPVTDNGSGYVYESPPGWMETWRAQGGTTRCWGPLLKIPGRVWDPISKWKH